jgi:hypothetical protein
MPRPYKKIFILGGATFVVHEWFACAWAWQAMPLKKNYLLDGTLL